MNGHKFLHVGFNWADGKPKIAELEPLFNHADDWIRYAANCWVVHTTEDANAWYERVRKYMTSDDRVLICELNPSNKQGWLDKWMWTRINHPGGQ